MRRCFQHEPCDAKILQTVYDEFCLLCQKNDRPTPLVLTGTNPHLLLQVFSNQIGTPSEAMNSKSVLFLTCISTRNSIFQRCAL